MCSRNNIPLLCCMTLVAVLVAPASASVFSPVATPIVVIAQQGCCFTDGTCQMLPPDECQIQGGFPVQDPCKGDSNGNGIDDACETQNEVACCIDDQCYYLPPAQCLDSGGFFPPGGVCLGDADNNGKDDACEELGACCYEQPVLCAVTTQVYCQQFLGGTWQGPGTDCTDADGNGVADACEQTNEVACCLPDGLCIYTTPIDCRNQGGYPPPTGVCLGDSNSNGVDDACEEIGACCFEIDPIQCTMTPQVYCEKYLFGTWYGPGSSCVDADGNGVADICEQPIDEACCLPGGTCTYLPAADCFAQGGYPPPGGVCLGDADNNGVDDACEDSGACCYEEPVLCLVTTQTYCEQMLGGTWYGPGTDCLDTNGDGVADICEPIEEACCLPGGTCTYLPPADCTAMGGYIPPGGLCLGDADGNGVDDACDELGACCYEEPVLCMVTTQTYCEQMLGGNWYGPGTDCLDTDGNGVADICEEPELEGCCLPDGSCVWVPPTECHQLGGFTPPLGVCLGDSDGNGVDDACEDDPAPWRIEFSLDIGSDTELSDPFMNGNEAFDPGDVYLWQSAPVLAPGRDGFKDDAFIFGTDPYPAAPDPTYSTVVPVGQGTIDQYREYFDLDGHDQLGVSLFEMQIILYEEPVTAPIPAFGAGCIYEPFFPLLSFDDDKADGWPAFDVPVTTPSAAGVSSYGTTVGHHEIVGLTLLPAPSLPLPVHTFYPLASERLVHTSLRPNPNFAEERDDDVDSLDIVTTPQECPYWYFTADQEAFLGLDPGDIYEVTPFGPVPVINKRLHLGLAPETDIDAFEFAWLQLPDVPGALVFGILFSVDNDDSLTPWDESGGLNPRVIYASTFQGFHYEFVRPMQDDIDAITLWFEPLAPGPGVCPGDSNCDGFINYLDIDYFVAAQNDNIGAWTALFLPGSPTCPFANNDTNLDGFVNYLDIDPFVALQNTTCP